MSRADGDTDHPSRRGRGDEKGGAIADRDRTALLSN